LLPRYAREGRLLSAARKTRLLSKPGCDLELVCDQAAFDALGPEWDALFARSGKPQQVFQTFGWLWHWANHYLDEDTRLSIVTGRSEGRLVLVWPLVSTRVMGLRVLSFMGEPVSQYGDALVEAGLDVGGFLDAALDFVMALPVDVVSLRRIRDDAALAVIFDRFAGQAGATAQAPFVDFAGAKTIAAFEKRFPAKLRSSRRRHLRRLEDIGPAAFETHGAGPQARDLVDLGLAFKRDWALRGGHIAPALLDPRFQRFFADAAGGGAHAQALRVSVVRCAGEPVGIEISVGCKGWLFGHVLAAKPGFEKCGAGAIAAGHSIASAVEQGYTVFDLLAPADPYKMEWASGSIGVRDFAVARTLAGGVFKRAWLEFGRDAVKSIAKSIPQLLRARENFRLTNFRFANFRLAWRQRL
jgi:CelD/BcsL family acetyltransferase involved in cellulose biosynthesis